MYIYIIIEIFSRQISPARSPTHNTCPINLTAQIRSMISNSNSFANRFGIFVFCQNSQNLLSNSLAIGFSIYSKLANSSPFLAFMHTYNRLDILHACAFIASWQLDDFSLIFRTSRILFLPSQNCQTLGDVLFVPFPYRFGSWQITTFAKQNLQNCWSCSYTPSTSCQIKPPSAASRDRFFRSHK